MEKQLTVSQYADIRKITHGAVRKAIKLGHNLPGVSRRDKFGNAHILYVPESWIKQQKRNSKKVA